MDLFKLSTLTIAINTLPKPPSMLGDSGLFTEQPVSTTTVIIESINGRLSLVENISRSADPQPKGNSKRVRRTFELPHLPVSTQILPTELEVAAFGESDKPAEQAKVINDKLQGLKNDLEATKEYHRMGAISGKIMDADGTTVIYDLFREFGVTEKSISIAFGTETTDIRAKVMEGKRHAKKALGGALVTAWTGYCSPDYFDKLVAHPNVQKAYANYQESADRLGGDVRSGFVFAGVTWIEYDVEVDGHPFIPANKARLVPTATGLFKSFNGPANYNETVNTLGKPMYAKAEERRMGKGWDLEAQANTLQMCTAPGALVVFSAS